MGRKRGAQFKRVNKLAWVRMRMPLHDGQREKFQLLRYAALDSFPRGDADAGTWLTLSDSVNMAKAMYYGEYGSLIDDAVAALIQVQKRAERTGTWGMSGDELSAVRAVLPLLDAQYESVTVRGLERSMEVVR